MGKKSLPINLKVKGIEPKQDLMVSHIFKFTSNTRVRLPHARNRDSQAQEMFLAPPADKQSLKNFALFN